MNVYYFQNGNWVQYNSARVLGVGKFSYVQSKTGKTITVQGRAVGFEDLGVPKTLPKATYFKNVNPKIGPKIFAFLESTGKPGVKPVTPMPEPTPEPEIALPEEKKFPWGWAVLGVVGGYIAYSFYRKKGRK